MKFDGQDVLVVGGSSGIGEAAARAAAAGASVTIASRDAAKLAASAARIGHGVRTGVMDRPTTRAYVHFRIGGRIRPRCRVGRADTHGAGAWSRARRCLRGDGQQVLGRLSRRAGRTHSAGRIADVRVGLPERAAEQDLGPARRDQRGARIAGAGLALELSPVRVNTVSPGLIATPLWSKLDAQARDRMYEGAAARLPAGRVGQPEDVANAVLYLASTPYATGSTVLVDGGGAIA